MTSTLTPKMLSFEEEKGLILQAQQVLRYGSSILPTASAQAAQEQLVRAYLPLILRQIAGSHLVGEQEDDLEADLIEITLAAIQTHRVEQGTRLASRLPLLYKSGASEFFARRQGLTLSGRRLREFLVILSEAVDPLTDTPSYQYGLQAAQDFGMTSTTFNNLWASVALGVLPLPERSTQDMKPVDGVDLLADRLARHAAIDLVHELLDKLDAVSASVLRLKFGFTDDVSLNRLVLDAGFKEGEPLTDKQIVGFGLAGCSTSDRVAKVRLAAMAQLRKELGR